MTKRCAIVIPFVELNHYLLETVRGCLALDYDNFRIILIADAPLQLPPDFQNKKITILRAGENKTIAAKRNMAIEQCSDADYIALIDSDAYPEKDWLQNSICFLEKHPNVWAVGGPNLTPPEEPILQRSVGNAQKSFLVSGPLAFTKTKSKSRYCANLHSCNLILPKQAFEVIGGFDETLFTGEDRNLCGRITASRKKIYFHSNVIVYHHNRSLWRPLFLQRLTYGYCSTAIARKQLNHSSLMLHLPIGWLMIICLLGSYEQYYNSSMTITCLILLLHFLAAVIVAVNVSNRILEIPYTLAAIVVTFAGMALGQILALTGIRLNLSKLYSNAPPQPNIS